MDLLKLFNPSYLFSPVPGSEFATAWLVYGFFILLFAGSFCVRALLAKRPHAKLEAAFFGGIPARMREFAVVALLFTFFRDQNIPYLGMRVFLVLIGLSMLAYAIVVFRNYKKNFAHRLVTSSTSKKVDKYKPAKKGRR